MNRKARLNALETALNNEMRERAFYLRHAARTKNPVGRAMFQQIGDEEIEHYERLKELRLQYNPQRQSTITEELMDIVAGFEALTGENSNDG